MSMVSERRCALITGGAKGIGREIATTLACDGIDIVITENTTSASETLQEINKSGVKGISVKGDVSDSKTALLAIDTCIKQFGRIDILVNNAGITKDSLLLRMKNIDWETVISVNLTGTFNFTKLASKYMIKQKAGRIINITSVVGITGNAGQSNYAASKAGIIGFTKSVSKELASRGITANAVAPGFIVTDMTEGMDEKNRQKLIDIIPAKYFGTPKDVAYCVQFLASEKASYITGQVLHVNGGMFM